MSRFSSPSFNSLTNILNVSSECRQSVQAHLGYDSLEAIPDLRTLSVPSITENLGLHSVSPGFDGPSRGLATPSDQLHPEFDLENNHDSSISLVVSWSHDEFQSHFNGLPRVICIPVPDSRNGHGPRPVPDPSPSRFIASSAHGANPKRYD